MTPWAEILDGLCSSLGHGSITRCWAEKPRQAGAFFPPAGRIGGKTSKLGGFAPGIRFALSVATSINQRRCVPTSDNEDYRRC